MFVILHALGMLAVDLFKSRSRLEAENLFLRHQLNIALRRAPPRLRLRGSDRALLILITKLWPSLLGVARVVQPETILRWHRAGFKVFWRWKSRNRAGRPKIDRGLRDRARQRPCLRTRLHVSGGGDGYPRPADLSWITMAKWLRGTSDRHLAARVPGSGGHLRRGAPAANSFRLCGVLQSSAYAPGITERCAFSSNSPTIGHHCRHSDLGRAASPIRPDMIFGKDKSVCGGAGFWPLAQSEAMSLSAVKRTLLPHRKMSAYDPKRHSRPHYRKFKVPGEHLAAGDPMITDDCGPSSARRSQSAITQAAATFSRTERDKSRHSACCCQISHRSSLTNYLPERRGCVSCFTHEGLMSECVYLCHLTGRTIQASQAQQASDEPTRKRGLLWISVSPISKSMLRSMSCGERVRSSRSSRRCLICSSISFAIAIELSARKS